MITGSVQEEDFILINIYAPNTGPPIHTTNTNRHKGRMDRNTIVGDFNTPLTPMDRSSRQNQ